MQRRQQCSQIVICPRRCRRFAALAFGACPLRAYARSYMLPPLRDWKAMRTTLDSYVAPRSGECGYERALKLCLTRYSSLQHELVINACPIK